MNLTENFPQNENYQEEDFNEKKVSVSSTEEENVYVLNDQQKFNSYIEEYE